MNQRAKNDMNYQTMLLLKLHPITFYLTQKEYPYFMPLYEYHLIVDTSGAIKIWKINLIIMLVAMYYFRLDVQI
jgi:hypothetical protein